jgi:hypothetical protein
LAFHLKLYRKGRMINMIEVGQTVFVETSDYYGVNPSLQAYLVSKVNGSSFYATRKDSKFEERFDKKTMSAKSGLGYSKKAYLSEQEYRNMINRKEEALEIRNVITNTLPKLTLEQLQEIYKLMKSW